MQERDLRKVYVRSRENIRMGNMLFLHGTFHLARREKYGRDHGMFLFSEEIQEGWKGNEVRYVMDFIVTKYVIQAKEEKL